MIIQDMLDLTEPRQKTVGNHSVWLRPLYWTTRGMGIKIPFQFGGRVQKYQKPQEDSYDIATIGEEYAFLKWLSARGLAPQIGRWVYFKTVISEHTGAWWADPLGAYGFEVQDVENLPLGPVTRDVISNLRASGLVVGSDGAWNDLFVPERGNIRNGYIIDVRRSWFDRLKFLGDVENVPRYVPDLDDIQDRLRREASFPFQQRELPYQEYLLLNTWHRAERSVVHRAHQLLLRVFPGQSVLDLGCCTGGFLSYAMQLDAGACVGLDTQPEFIALARDIARVNGHNICYRVVDLREPSFGLFTWLDRVFPNGLDHLLLLSMGKHIGEDVMWSYVDTLVAGRSYIETNAVKDPPYPYADGCTRRGGVLSGFTNDRNTRATYLIER